MATVAFCYTFVYCWKLFAVPLTPLYVYALTTISACLFVAYKSKEELLKASTTSTRDILRVACIRTFAYGFIAVIAWIVSKFLF